MKKNLLLFALLFIVLSESASAQWSTSGSNVYLTTSTNNVGIGTSAPAYKLDVSGSAGVGSTTVNNNTTKLYLRNAAGKTWAFSSGLNLVNETSFGIYDWTDNATTALFTIPAGSSSNVDVTNSLSVGNDNVNSNTTKLYLQNASGKTWALSSGANAYNETNFGIYDWTDNQTTPFFGITSGGNIGIGTNSPSQKLQVNGTTLSNVVWIGSGITSTNASGYLLAVNGSAIFTKAVVKLQANWPDYVFEKKYNLMSISELEKYVSINKHLPGLPSETAIEKSGGVDVGATTTALLQKVEELTLYVIQLKEENVQIKKQIRRLSGKR